MIIHFLFLALYFSFNVSFSPEYLNILLIIHCAIALLFKLNRGDQLITPLNVYFIGTSLISIGNIVTLGKIGTSANKTSAYASIPDIPEGNFIWCIGCTCAFIGYELFSDFSFASIAFDFDKSKVKMIYYVLLFIGIFYPVIASALLFLGSMLKLLYLAGSIGVMYFARLWISEENNKYRNYAIVLYVVQTYLALEHAYLRFEVILPTLVFLVGYLIGYGSLRGLLSYRVVPFIVVIVCFMSIFQTLGKGRGNFGVVISEEYLTAPTDAEQDNNSVDVYAEEENNSGGFFDRSSIIAQTSTCVRLVRRNGFYNGVASYPILVALIPRFLWPDKPLIMIGQWFAVETGTAILTNGSANNSINMTIPGELYLDFGWLGVFFGCIFFGGFISTLWNSVGFYASPYNLMGTLFGGYLIILSISGIAGDLQIVVTYISVYIMFFVVKKIACEYFV